MLSGPYRLSRPDIETKVLQYLCDSTKDVESRRAVLQVLAENSWLDADNEILYECIGVLFSVDPQRILFHLPSVLTRRGFPDISCKQLAGPSLLHSMAAICLANDLLRLSSRATPEPSS
ncbi:MAG TPA: hypothetical protein VGT03_07300 [Candidatus Acidoferrales bacterium]|nr:hypothetical protein [Candidatus Acidoferrales bacterium]